MGNGFGVGWDLEWVGIWSGLVFGVVMDLSGSWIWNGLGLEGATTPIPLDITLTIYLPSSSHWILPLLFTSYYHGTSYYHLLLLGDNLLLLEL